VVDGPSNEAIALARDEERVVAVLVRQTLGASKGWREVECEEGSRVMMDHRRKVRVCQGGAAAKNNLRLASRHQGLMLVQMQVAVRLGWEQTNEGLAAGLSKATYGSLRWAMVVWSCELCCAQAQGRERETERGSGRVGEKSRGLMERKREKA
jgi:hypothetical protein